VEFAVYIGVPLGDDGNRIARGVHDAATRPYDFSIRQEGDPSESSDVELCFRISGVEYSEDAISRALELYDLGRREAGLQPDLNATAHLVAD
jgi:hypothetical protein